MSSYAYTTVYSGAFSNGPSDGPFGGLSFDITASDFTENSFGNVYSDAGEIVVLQDPLSDSRVVFLAKYYYSSGYMYLDRDYTNIPGDVVYIQKVTSIEGGEVAFEWENIDISVNSLLFYSGDKLTEEIFKWDDYIVTSDANDVVWGYRGADRIYGHGGDDELYGGDGDDALYSGDGDDTLNGGSGKDTLVAGDGNDSLNGGSGNDYLSGGSGDDHLAGHTGTDMIFGGSGNDHVYYLAKASDYVLSKHPLTNIIYTTYENGYDKGALSDVEEIHFEDGVILSTDDISYTGIFNDIPNKAVIPIYRFYNTDRKAYFYTASADERDYVLANSEYDKPDSVEWPYVYQGSTFEAAHSYTNSQNFAPIHQFYNTATGHHFYTISQAEANMVNGKILSGEWPFQYTGTTFNVYSADPTPGSVGEELAVHMFYSPSLNRHFYSGDLQEVAEMKLTGVWDYYGVSFFGEISG